MEPLVIFSLGLVVWCGRVTFADYFRDMAELLPQRKEKKRKPAAAPVRKLCFQSPVEKMAGLHVGQRL